MKRKSKEIFLILHNVRSAHNVGSLFRTADAAGVSKIYLCGITPVPGQRGRAGRELLKTALGAEMYVPWQHYSQVALLIKKLRTEKVTVVALEQAKNALPYNKYKPRYPIAVVVGNELQGISPSILKSADAVIKIPMSGRKESLNVGVAAGIALFELRKKK